MVDNIRLCLPPSGHSLIIPSYVKATTQSTQWYFGTREASGVSVSSLGNRTIITLPNDLTIVATGGTVSFTSPANRELTPQRNRSPEFRGYRDFRDTSSWGRNQRRRGRGQGRNSSSGSGTGSGSNRPGPRGPVHANRNGNGNQNSSSQTEQRARADLERQRRNNRLSNRQQRSQGGGLGIDVRVGYRNADAVLNGTTTAARTANAATVHSLPPTSVIVNGARPTASAPPTTYNYNTFAELTRNRYGPSEASHVPRTTEDDDITVLGSRPVSRQNYLASQRDYAYSQHPGDEYDYENEDWKIEVDGLIGELGLDGDEVVLEGLRPGYMDLTEEL